MHDEEFEDEDEEKTSPWLFVAGAVAIVVFIGIVASWGGPKFLSYLANEGTIPPPPPPAVVENAPPTLDLVSPSGDVTITAGEHIAIVAIITDDRERSLIEAASQIGELTPQPLMNSSVGGGEWSDEWIGTADFTTPGVYKLTISATDNDGAKTSRAITVTVNAAEQPVTVTTPEPAPVPVETPPPVATTPPPAEEPVVVSTPEPEAPAPPPPATPAPEVEATATERKVVGKTIAVPGVGELFVTDDRAYVIKGAKTVDVACLAQVGGSTTPVALRGESCRGVTARCLPLPAGVVKDGKERTCPKSAKPVAPATKPAAKNSAPASTGTTTSSTPATTPAAAKPICYINEDPENDAWRCNNAMHGATHVESLNGVPNYTVGP